MISSEKYPMAVLSGDGSIRTNNNLVFLDTNRQESYLEVWRPPARPLNIKDVSKEYVVPYKYQFRADLISQVMYGTPIMAWAVCFYNDILDPFDVEAGLYAGRVINIVNVSYFSQVNANVS